MNSVTNFLQGALRLLHLLNDRQPPRASKPFIVVLCLILYSFSILWLFGTSNPPSHVHVSPHTACMPCNSTVAVNKEAHVKSSLPKKTRSPGIVYFVWCGERWFEFAHYMSVMSVNRHLGPDRIELLYDAEPQVDSSKYNTWIKEMPGQLPHYNSRRLGSDERGCSGKGRANRTFIERLLMTRGGMYVNESTIIANFPLRYRLHHIVRALNNDSSIAFLMVSKNLSQSLSKAKEEDRSRALDVSYKSFTCVDRRRFANSTFARETCIQITEALYPKDIWELDDPFGRHIRTLFYGTPDVQRAVPSYVELVPNIAHVVWLGGGEMDFLFFLCVNSLVYLLGADMVYMHGDGPPRGRYWELIKNNPKLQLVHHERPTHIYGHVIRDLSHASDILRLDVMIKHGGIYVDTDAIFVRPLSREQRAYDTTMIHGFTGWYTPFPTLLLPGLLVGRKNATFFRLFLESMKVYDDTDWDWNSCRRPYQVMERDPGSVHLDRAIQVECYEGMCHPLWWPDHRNGGVHHLNRPMGDWRNITNAFHWTGRTPDELTNHVKLYQINSTFSEIGRHVIEKAGLTYYFLNLVRTETGAGLKLGT